MPTRSADIHNMAIAYTEAWCSQSGEAVAAFYEENASSIINGAAATIGRVAIAEEMQQFFIELPDLVLRMDDLRSGGNQAIYLWTLVGTHRETDNFVKISGWQNWLLSDDLHIIKADGGYDAADYQRQIEAEQSTL